MKLIKNVYKHVEEGFTIEVDSCNKKVAKCINQETGEKVMFNRGKLEFMINKGVFEYVGKMEGCEI